MLSPEHFIDVKNKIKGHATGITISNDARYLLSTIIGVPGERVVYVKVENRYYRIGEERESILIEGFVGWPHSSKMDMKFLYPERMNPIEVSSNGIISSGGERLSPLDERLEVTAHDLLKGHRVTEDEYGWEQSTIDNYK